MVDAGVHVDVVADRDRQQHLQLASLDDDVGIRVARGVVGDERAHIAPRLRAEREEVVEVRPAEHVGRHAHVDVRDERVQIDRVIADRDERTRLPAAAPPDTERQVREREVGVGRDLDRARAHASEVPASRACSASIDMNSALKLPSPKPRAPTRWMISRKAVGRLATDSVNTCKR